MLKRVRSDLETFNDVLLVDGMNVILADRAEDSDETESTNGLGKSTFIRIIHFCLGSDFSREKVLDHPELKGVTFFLDLERNGLDVTVARNTAREKHVRVTTKFLEGLDVEFIRAGDDVADISLDDWKLVLAQRYFPEAVASKRKYVPSFRDLAVYFCRLGKPAYADPATAFQNQSGSVKRLCVSFLLKLNWPKQREMELETQKREQNTAALEALRAAEESKDILTIGDLEAKRVGSEIVLKRKREEVDSFNVRADYRDLENSLHSVDKTIHELINDNFGDRRLLDFYNASAKDVPEADPERPLAILRDAGAVFKDESLRTIEEVSKFHRDVYRNRREFLKGEIARLSADIEKRSSQI